VGGAPSILLADEPTGNLDRRNSELVADIFKELSEKGGQSIVMVTHDLSLANRARRLVRMEDGEVVGDSAVQSASG
jgi:lipoprotein-releasing system ATP-binding protein